MSDLIKRQTEIIGWLAEKGYLARTPNKGIMMLTPLGWTTLANAAYEDCNIKAKIPVKIARLLAGEK